MSKGIFKKPITAESLGLESKKLKQKLKTYLAGPIGDVPLKEARTWRDMVTERLAQMGIGVLNPLHKESEMAVRRKLLLWSRTGNIDALRPLVNKELIDPDLEMVEASDFVTMWLPKEGQEVCGSYGEITHAYSHEVPVYVVTERKTRPLNIPYWAIGCSTKIFRSWDDYFKYVEENWPVKNGEEKPKEEAKAQLQKK